ncbi:MAG: hypothetical protein JRI41_10850 [Deltaproteobacteria bacterium]|nr:hypothetical protein [Deltaproteobacteria bacterium]
MTVAPIYVYPGVGKFIGPFIGVILAWLIFRQDILPMCRTHLIFEDDSLSGWVDGYSFRVFWDDIVAAQFHKMSAQSYLFLVTSDGAFNISLKYLNAAQIWKLVQSRVRPSALKEGAYKELPAYNEWVSANAELISSVDVPLRVKSHWLIRVVGWGGIVFFLSLAVLFSWGTGIGFYSFFFLGMSMLGVALLLLDGSVEMDSHAVTYATPLGRYKMRWEEIQRIEYDLYQSWLVFYGGHKRLALWGPGYWLGEDRARMYEFLIAQIQQRDIEMRYNEWAVFKLSSRSARE